MNLYCVLIQKHKLGIDSLGVYYIVTYLLFSLQWDYSFLEIAMVRVIHFISLLLFLSPGAIPITREIEEMVTLGRSFTLCLARGNTEGTDFNHSQHCYRRYERTAYWTSCLAARKSASPTGSGGCWQRWPRASNEEVGVDGTTPCRCAEFGRERALGKGCMGHFWPWDLWNAVSLGLLTAHSVQKQKSPSTAPRSWDSGALSTHEHKQPFLDSPFCPTATCFSLACYSLPLPRGSSLIL